MIREVYGVDYSGAARSGRTAWLAALRPISGGRVLRLDVLEPLGKLFGTDRRAGVNAGLVDLVKRSRRALWGLNFPFGLPVEVMPPGWRWRDQFRFLRAWGEDAYGAGVACVMKAKSLGLPMHVRRLTDVEHRTPFDVYHYRIIYQTFYGMRDVLGPLLGWPDTAIMPFDRRRYSDAVRVVAEACPSSTLKLLGLPFQNYKQAQGGPLTGKRRRTRREILDGLAGVVRVPERLRLKAMRDGGADGLDAILCGLGAWRAWKRGVGAIPKDARVGREGWHYA